MVPRPNLSGDSIFLLHPGPLNRGVLPLLCPQHVHTWSKGTTTKVQAKKGKNASKKMHAQKGAMFSRIGGLASSSGFISLS